MAHALAASCLDWRPVHRPAWSRRPGPLLIHRAHPYAAGAVQDPLRKPRVARQQVKARPGPRCIHARPLGGSERQAMPSGPCQAFSVSAGNGRPIGFIGDHELTRRTIAPCARMVRTREWVRLPTLDRRHERPRVRLKTGCVDEVHRARCAAHGLASYTLISEDLFALDVVALLAAEGQQVSIVGELPANDHFVEAVVDGDHQRLSAGFAGW